MKYVKLTGLYGQSTTDRSTRAAALAPRCACARQSYGQIVSIARAFLALSLIALLSACKLQIVVPKGGMVVSESGAYVCLPGETCEIDVSDQYFEETFVAEANEGFVFKGWAKQQRALCGEQDGPCALATGLLSDDPRLSSVLESDTKFYLLPVFEKAPRLKEADIRAEGDVRPTSDGFAVSGSVAIRLGDNIEKVFSDADLELSFNSRGELVSMVGEGVLPSALTEHVALPASVRAEIGFYTGAQINADDSYEIVLQDERQYFVFLVDAGIDYRVSNRQNPDELQTITVGTPAAGKIVMILDPLDAMLYRYGETPLVGAFGEAQSDQGLLPYRPWVDNERLDQFDGHSFKTISLGVGIKAVDFLQLSGSQVVLDPKFADIDLSAPFTSDVKYRAGFNGAAEFAFSVFGFDIFAFDLARSSASFEVSGKRQAMTLVANLEPDVSWLPGWVTIVPETRLDLDLTADSAGDLQMNIAGSYVSTLPRAGVEGSVHVNPAGVTFQGRVVDYLDVPVSMSFYAGETHATVGIDADYADEIDGAVVDAFDRAQAELDRALADLDQAVETLEFEASLRGLRAALPGIADQVLRILDDVPGRVYSTVNSRAKSTIDGYNKCPLGICIISSSLRNKVAAAAASTARERAYAETAAHKNAMQELKRRALEADDESLRAALEQALRTAYSYRTLDRTISYRVGIDGIFSKTFSYRLQLTILSSGQAEQILFAADNMYRIPAASENVIRARQIVDALPAEQILDQVRREVEGGVRSVPGISELGYSVIGGNYSAYVQLSDGRVIEVGFNALDPEEALAGIGELLVEQLSGR